MTLLKTASRKNVTLKLGIFGPSGSGKTMSALKLARGLCDAWENIAVVDTENGSAELYSHLGPFLHCDLKPPFTPSKFIDYIAMIRKEAPHVQCIILDSISHEYSGTGGLLEIVDNIAAGRTKGNTFQAWAKAGPDHVKFINAILYAECHIICTGRTKTEWVVAQNDKGKSVPQKIGTKVEQRDGFEYELALAFRINDEHLAVADKDRTDLFKDKHGILIDESVGKMIREWNEKGAAAPAPECRILPEIFEVISKLTDKYTLKDRLDALREEFRFMNSDDLKVKPKDELEEILLGLKKLTPAWFTANAQIQQ